MRIGFYTTSNRLLEVSATDGLSSGSSGAGAPLLTTRFTLSHYRDAGMTPTLEVNGRAGLDWTFQRELFRTADGFYARAAEANALIEDTVQTFYGQAQILDTICGSHNAIGANGGIALVGTATNLQYPMPFGTPVLLCCGAVKLITDTITPLLAYDSVSIIMQRYCADALPTSSWLGSTGSVRFTLAIRSAATDSVLCVLDTMSATWHDLAFRGDTARFSLYDFRDSAIYFALTIDTANVHDAAETAMLVVDEYDPTPDTSEGGIGKRTAMRDAGRAGEVPVQDNPIDLTAYPDPFSNHVQFMFTVPPDDGDDMTALKVFTITGGDVATLLHDVKPTGRYTVNYDATELRTGQYVVAVHTKTHMQSKLIVVVK